MKITPILVLFCFYSVFSFSASASLCGPDDRKPSHDPKVAFLLHAATDKKGCSGALVGKGCLVTAGHCRGHFKVAKFDPWENIPENVYELDKSTVEGDNQLYDHDWAVYRLKPNVITGKLPGEVRPSYEIDLTPPIVGEVVRVTGHGYADSKTLRYTQQTSTGLIVSVDPNKTVIFHRVDATHGNSGSGLIRVSNGKLIGVHFKGGCKKSGKGANRATSLYYNKAFQRALLSCLAKDKL